MTDANPEPQQPAPGRYGAAEYVSDGGGGDLLAFLDATEYRYLTAPWSPPVPASDETDARRRR